MKFLYFILSLGLGFVVIRYSKWIVDNTGVRFGFAESFFGYGGTYTALKLLGVGLIIFAFYYVINM